MKVDPTLQGRKTIVTLDLPNLGTGHQTLGPDDVINYGTKLVEVLIGQLLGSLVIEVHEKLEPVRLLLDHEQFQSRIDRGDI